MILFVCLEDFPPHDSLYPLCVVILIRYKAFFFSILRIGALFATVVEVVYVSWEINAFSQYNL